MILCPLLTVLGIELKFNSFELDSEVGRLVDKFVSQSNFVNFLDLCISHLVSPYDLLGRNLCHKTINRDLEILLAITRRGQQLELYKIPKTLRTESWFAHCKVKY